MARTGHGVQSSPRRGTLCSGRAGVLGSPILPPSLAFTTWGGSVITPGGRDNRSPWRASHSLPGTSGADEWPRLENMPGQRSGVPRAALGSPAPVTRAGGLGQPRPNAPETPHGLGPGFPSVLWPWCRSLAATQRKWRETGNLPPGSGVAAGWAQELRGAAHHQCPWPGSSELRHSGLCVASR